MHYSMQEGAWYSAALCGRGKRTGGYGSFLLAVYAPEDEELQTISKIGTGFSEEQLVQLSEQLKALVIPAPKPYYRRAPRFCELDALKITMSEQLRALVTSAPKPYYRRAPRCLGRAGHPLCSMLLFCKALRCLAWLLPMSWGCVHCLSCCCAKLKQCCLFAPACCADAELIWGLAQSSASHLWLWVQHGSRRQVLRPHQSLG